MKPIRYFLLKGNENVINHVKSVDELGCIYWRKSTRIWNVGDIIYLYLSKKRYNRICYRLEVVDTSVPRQDASCWYGEFKPDDSTYKLIPTSKLYKGNMLGLDEIEKLGINRYTQYQELTVEQVEKIDRHLSSLV